MDQQSDRLSALFDSLLEDIISLLPIHAATSTSVLSTSYRLLWTQRAHADLTTVPRAHLTPSPLVLPHSLFQMQTLVTLSLPLFYVENYDAPFLINLPNLKVMSLTFDVSHCGFVSRLVESCSLLQDLSLTATDDDPWETEHVVISLSSPSLIKLCLLSFERNIKVLVNAPQLEYFGLHEPMISCSFVSKPLRLREAVVYEIREEELMTVILPQISSVSKLVLFAEGFGLVDHCRTDQGTPVSFRNLTELTLTGLGSTNSPSMSLHVKRINLRVCAVGNGNYLREKRDYFLSNAPSLEVLRFLVIGPTSNENSEKEKLAEILFSIDLYKYVKTFSPCFLIEFQGACVNLPANIDELEEMEKNAEMLQVHLSQQ